MSCRRRIGHWLTDATPLLPLLVGGQQCRFTAQTAPWALPWLPSLRLRFSWDDAAGELELSHVRLSIAELWMHAAME